MTELEIIKGNRDLIHRLRIEYDARKRRGEKHPDTIYISAQAYDLMMDAIAKINGRIDIPSPVDGLYTFRGIKLRRARENESG